jgi:hypothetical protein
MPLAFLVACGIPTEAPKSPILDLRWVVPSQSTRITVSNLLPSGVTITPDSSGFTVSAASASVTRILSQDCSACVATNGLVAAKPAFVATASTTTSLPTDISSATLTGGTLQVVFNHNYTFDPLRPSVAIAAPKGYAVITVSNGTSVIGKDSIDGATTALPANTPLTRSIALSGTISGSSPVTVSVSLNSPVGDPALIDASRTISVTATPTNLKVASANVAVVGRQVNSSSTFDLSGVDSTVTNHVQVGSLMLTIVNPFTVTGTLTAKLTPQGGATISKTVVLTAGSGTAKLDFTNAELKSLLGQSVMLTYSGAVNSTAGAVNVTPKQAVVVTSRLDITLQVGG